MIRLLIASDDESRWRGIESRLAGVAVEVCRDPARHLDAPDGFDAVVLTGSQRVEASVTERLLRAGKHVLHAGEPTLSWNEFESLWQMARQLEVQFAVVNPDHHLPSRQFIKQQIPDRLGQVGLIRIHRWQPAATDTPESPSLPGPLIRDLELTLWLAGNGPNCVFALENRTAGARSLQVHLGFPRGGMALIDHAGGLPPGDGYQSLSVIGSSGAAYADDQQNTQLLFRGGSAKGIRVEEGIHQYADLLRPFVDSLRTRQELPGGHFAWWEAFAVADAVSRSLATRQAVHLEGA
jgi:predicted dehydrogenase